MGNPSHYSEQLICNDQQGYMALLTVTIIGLVTFALTMATQANTLSHSSDITDNAHFQQAIELTHSCLEQAREQLLIEPQYSGGNTINTAGYQCSILSFDRHNDAIEIITKAEFKNSFAQLKTTLDSYSLAILSQQLTN